jgi:acyl carrier protein
MSSSNLSASNDETQPINAALVLDGVVRSIQRAVPKTSRGVIDTNTSIVDDLGIDSLNIINLTLALEEELGIAEFPMQAWYDGELSKNGRRFTVGALATACVQYLRGGETAT